MNIVTTSSTSTLIPDVSVIIPTYNRITMLEEALASLHAQEYDGMVEIIVIDDNSQDGTSQIIREKYTDIHLITLSENGGASAARNQGIAVAKGEFIAFLDSDDLWEPDHLRSQIALLKSKNITDTQTHFGVSDIFIWETIKDIRYQKSQKPKPQYSSTLHHLLSGGSFVSTPSAVIFPKHILDEIGIFDNNLRLAEDTDLYTRAILKDFKPVFTEQASVVRRKHDSGQAMTIKNIEPRITNRLDALRKYYPLAKQRLGNVKQSQIHSEIYSDFARYYYEDKSYGDWLKLLLISTRYSSPLCVIRTNWHYINDFFGRIISKLRFAS
ncbi:glycosyltransferase family 2 protein [Leptothoe spongobia]|uniref:Glycosyltransferase family 2 protein n=1 Tax=Leptothoe spongobia TAU-MAC 1115 TaxID=1967444 RepID=A0A947DE71_9CYAN|nr:glycosyltransferase family 2 protein [Leptothoe spongobia]MBT9314744.1 glycosyltransferase family 2 protein [Leptothoe spongobia TAU-MAC 1115]